MRAAPLLLVGCLAMSAAGCEPADVKRAIVGRWESVEHPYLCCAFTEEETVRIWGDFGQVVGTYAVTEDNSVRMHLARRCGRPAPGWVVLEVTNDTLTLRTPEGIRVRLRRG
jgi:hypothetical protein